MLFVKVLLFFATSTHLWNFCDELIQGVGWLLGLFSFALLQWISLGRVHFLI
jgi:hypothetical protein